MGSAAEPHAAGWGGGSREGKEREAFRQVKRSSSLLATSLHHSERTHGEHLQYFNAVVCHLETFPIPSLFQSKASKIRAGFASQRRSMFF